MIEPFAYVRDLLMALSSDQADLNALLPDAWIAAHPEHLMKHRRDEAEAAANARRRRRALRREEGQAIEPDLLMHRRSRPGCLSFNDFG